MSQVNIVEKQSSMTEHVSKCSNCSTVTTPLWRRDSNGNTLCNACGLFLKLHGTPRPNTLVTGTIRPRNRRIHSNKHNSNSNIPRILPELKPLKSSNGLNKFKSILKRESRKSSSKIDNFKCQLPRFDLILKSATPYEWNIFSEESHPSEVSYSLNDEEETIRLHTKIKELELVTSLYKNYITTLTKKCKLLEESLNSKN